MAHNLILVIEPHIEQGGQTTDPGQEQERTPLLPKKNRQSRLSRLKDHHVFVNSKTANTILAPLELTVVCNIWTQSIHDPG